MTDFSGLIKKIQIRAPTSITPALTRNGATHKPRLKRLPYTTAVDAPPSAPTMFITPVTVPLNWPPTSMGTAHAGPITHSRKKKEAAKKRIELKVFDVNAAGITNALARINPGAATTRRARLAFSVCLKILAGSGAP